MKKWPCTQLTIIYGNDQLLEKKRTQKPNKSIYILNWLVCLDFCCLNFLKHLNSTLLKFNSWSLLFGSCYCLHIFTFQPRSLTLTSSLSYQDCFRLQVSTLSLLLTVYTCLYHNLYDLSRTKVKFLDSLPVNLLKSRLILPFCRHFTILLQKRSHEIFPVGPHAFWLLELCSKCPSYQVLLSLHLLSTHFPGLRSNSMRLFLISLVHSDCSLLCTFNNLPLSQLSGSDPMLASDVPYTTVTCLNTYTCLISPAQARRWMGEGNYVSYFTHFGVFSLKSICLLIYSPYLKSLITCSLNLLRDFKRFSFNHKIKS